MTSTRRNLDRSALITAPARAPRPGAAPAPRGPQPSSAHRLLQDRLVGCFG
ncbi:MAG: hypothetical protein MUC84_05165 [Solirubrobacteraceae bacterium]|jgi:hypothetical protein|nr:hypothetical protein [Solirubrobacteraceae bacterium]